MIASFLFGLACLGDRFHWNIGKINDYGFVLGFACEGGRFHLKIDETQIKIGENK